jgi:hypothetical protein
MGQGIHNSYADTAELGEDLCIALWKYFEEFLLSEQGAQWCTQHAMNYVKIERQREETRSVWVCVN